MAVHEWTCVQELQFYPNGICKHMLRWDTGINVHSDYFLKMVFHRNKRATLNDARISH